MYTGTEPASVKPVDNATQATFYREALAMAFCQPNVKTFLFFHAVDESNLDRWQSGMYYADGTPKPSLAAVEDATRDARGGVIAKCPGLSLSPRAKVVYPRGKSLKKVPLKVRTHVRHRLQLPRAARALPARLDDPLDAREGARRRREDACACRHAGSRAGDYRFTVTLTAPLNTGPPTQLVSSRPARADYDRVDAGPVRRVHVLQGLAGVAAAAVEERAAGKDAFAEVVEEWAERLEHLQRLFDRRRAAGLRLLRLEDHRALPRPRGARAELNATPLAGWLETPYSYLATTKASQYTSARRARKIVPRGSPYLVVYPFVKVRPWYALPEEDRQRAMDEHIAIGATFPSIHNHTTYSFGIDDQEFMTAFECDEPADFMHLMLTLRESEASRYTERDTPIFVGHKVEHPRGARPARRRVGHDARPDGSAARRTCALPAPRAPHRVTAEAEHEDERAGVEPRGAGEQ